MKDRFDLEQDIINLWNTTNDIKVIWESILDSNMHWTTDDICNVLLGLEKLIDARGDRCFNTFEQAFKLDDYASDEVKELRNINTLCGHALCKYKEKEDE